VSFCRARGYRSIAIVGDESPLSRLLAQGFAEEIVRSGMRLTGAEYHADAVVSAGVRVAELLALLDRWRSREGMPPLLGSYNFSIADVQAQAGELMDGIAYVDAFDPRKPQAQAFVSSYSGDKGCAPGSVEGYGYDAILLFADALRRAGSVYKERVRPAMQAINLSGVLGAIGATYEFRDGERAGFDPHGLVVRVHGRPSPECVVHTGSH
jgi:branched-chain amino acid transport system substrate-binding protein